MLSIVEAYLPLGHPNRPGVALECLRSYVFHYTANESPTATSLANANYFGRAYDKGKYWSGNVIKQGIVEAGSKDSNGIGRKFSCGSTQVIADMNGVVLPIPITEKAYGCGDNITALAKKLFNGRQNSMTINVEICNNDAISNSTEDWDKACDNAIEFVARDIVYRNNGFDYNDPYAFLRHYDVSGKNCPAPFVDLNSVAVDPDWIAFKNKLINRIEELKNAESETVVIPAPTSVKKSGSAYFNDVPENHWSGEYIDKAKEYGLISGIEPGVLGFSEEFARVIAVQVNMIDLIEAKFGSLK